jgi:hypothetical protein
VGVGISPLRNKIAFSWYNAVFVLMDGRRYPVLIGTIGSQNIIDIAEGFRKAIPVFLSQSALLNGIDFYFGFLGDR